MDTPKVASSDPVVRDTRAYPTSPSRLPGSARPVVEFIDLRDLEPALPLSSAAPLNQASNQPELEPVEPMAHPRLDPVLSPSTLPERSRLSPSQRGALNLAAARADALAGVTSNHSPARS